MSEPVLASKSPFEVAVAAGETYYWCRCGRSHSQPFCDGSHKTTDITPVAWEAQESGTVWFCGCKRTGHQPMCDGTHNNL